MYPWLLCIYVVSDKRENGKMAMRANQGSRVICAMRLGNVGGWWLSRRKGPASSARRLLSLQTMASAVATCYRMTT
jgi:hypothetical protein